MAAAIAARMRALIELLSGVRVVVIATRSSGSAVGSSMAIASEVRLVRR